MESSRCKAFLAAVDCGSFSKAADKLNYTPSGVSQLVSALENELGLTLLERNNKGVHPSADGQLLVPAMREFLAQEERIYQTTAEILGLSIGRVSIASYVSVATHWLPQVISKFQKDYPGIQLSLMDGIHQDVNSWLDSKQADIAFTSYKEPMGYDWIPLAEDPMIAVLPKNHPLASESIFPVERIAEEKLIMPGLGHDDDVFPMFDKFGITPNIAYATIETFSALQMVEQGLGISIMNELITRNWQCDVVKLPIHPAQSITLGIAVPSLQHASPAVRKFIKYAQEVIQ